MGRYWLSVNMTSTGLVGLHLGSLDCEEEACLSGLAGNVKERGLIIKSMATFMRNISLRDQISL
jgi:hypothetical protein